MAKIKFREVVNNTLRSEMLKLGYDPAENFSTGVIALASKFDFNLKSIKSNKWNKVVYYLLRGYPSEKACNNAGAKRINTTKYKEFKQSGGFKQPTTKWDPSVFDADSKIGKAALRLGWRLLLMLRVR